MMDNHMKTHLTNNLEATGRDDAEQVTYDDMATRHVQTRSLSTKCDHGGEDPDNNNTEPPDCQHYFRGPAETQNPYSLVDDDPVDVLDTLEDVNDGNGDDYKCRFCGNCYVTIEFLVEHIELIHGNEKLIKCAFYDNCDKTFRLNEVLDMYEHMDKDHSDDEVEQEQITDSAPMEKLLRGKSCRFCGNSFATVESLVQHIELIHGNEELIKCAFYDTCGKTFRLNEVLDMYEHMDKDHSEDKRRICNRCGKKLCSELSLARHMRYHDNIKPFICRFCHKSYVETSTLYNHIKCRHIHAEPIACPFYPECDKTFWLNEMLAKHIKRSHKDKKQKSKRKTKKSHKGNQFKKDPVKCPLYYECGKMFRSNEMLAKHIEISHKDNEVVINVVVSNDKQMEEVPIGDRKCASSEEIFDITYNGQSVRFKMQASHNQTSPVPKVQKSRPDDLAQLARDKRINTRPPEASCSNKAIDEMSGPEHRVTAQPGGKCDDCGEMLDITPKWYGCRQCGDKGMMNPRRQKQRSKESLICIKCPFYESCGKLCQSNELMQGHVKEAHQFHTLSELGNRFTKAVNEGLICYHCLKVFLNKIALEAHIYRHHDDVNKRYRNATKQGNMGAGTRDTVCVSDDDDDESLSPMQGTNTSIIQPVPSPISSDQATDASRNQLVTVDDASFENEDSDSTISLDTENPEVCVSDDECISYVQDQDTVISQMVTQPMTTSHVLLDISEKQDATAGHLLLANGDPDFTLSSESVAEASVINIVPLDNDHELQVVEMDCNSLEDDTDPVIHNIVPIHDDVNCCEDEDSEWPYISEGAIKTEDNELIPLAVLPEYVNP